MRRPPLRWLVLVPLLAAVTVGFGVFAFVVEQAVRVDLVAGVDGELARAGQTSPPPGDRGAQPGGPGSAPTAPVDDTDTGLGQVDPPVRLEVTADGGIVADTGGTNPFSEGDLRQVIADEGPQTIDGARYRATSAATAEGTFLVTALSLEPVDSTVDTLRRVLLIGGLAILALEAVVVWIITTRVTRPVTRMTEVAGAIADGALDTEIGEPAGARETAELAEDLQLMLSRLRSTLTQSEQSAEDARKAHGDMRRFLADSSHELRTPLTALKGYSDLYAGDMLTEPADLDRAMGRIGSESSRLSDLVDAMLQLARGDLAEPDRRDAVGVVDLTRAVADDLRAAFRTADIEVTSPPTDQGVVLGDPDRLHQALLNLGANACRHGAGAPVRLAVEVDAGRVTVTVSDSGPGVDPADATRIFLPFFRADKGRSRAQGGAGLGLALTRQIAEQHGGTVDLVPSEFGATFVLALPTTHGAIGPVSGADGPVAKGVGDDSPGG